MLTGGPTSAGRHIAKAPDGSRENNRSAARDYSHGATEELRVVSSTRFIFGPLLSQRKSIWRRSTVAVGKLVSSSCTAAIMACARLVAPSLSYSRDT